jgi:hypothetical protein
MPLVLDYSQLTFYVLNYRIQMGAIKKYQKMSLIV